MLSGKYYFLTKRIVQYIMIVGEWEVTNVARIAKKAKMTFTHAFLITKYLESLNIIKAPKIGRVRKVELTEKGKEIYKHLKGISDIVELYKEVK